MMKNIKLFAMFIAGLSLAALATYAAPVAIEAAINSFTLYMNRILVTTTGGPDGQVVVDINNMDSSAALLVNSTTRGFLPPRLTTAQRDAINNPANGLIIFNSDLGFHQSYNGPSGNQPEYWQGVGTACPSVSILEVESTNLDPVLQFGAGFHSVGGDENNFNVAANSPENLLGMATISGISFYVQGALIVDTNNDRVLSAAEKSLFDDSILYGTLYMRPSGLIPLTSNSPGANKPTGRSILGGVVAENSDMFLYICGDLVPGCTDSSAENYDPQANIDDESCTQSSQIDVYFSSGSDAVYEANTGSDITFTSMIRDATCQSPIIDDATITASWSTTNGSSPSFVGSSYPYGSANVVGDTATWTVNSMYIGCSDIPLSLILSNQGSGQVTVDWSISINGDTDTANNTMAQYGTWTASQGGGGTDIYISNMGGGSGSAGSQLLSSAYMQNSCAGISEDVTVTASRSTNSGTAYYVSSYSSNTFTGGSYGGMQSVTWNLGDISSCGSASFSLTLSSANQEAATVYRSISSTNDSDSMNNSTSNNLTRSSGGGTTYDYGISSGTPSYPTNTAGNNITSTIYPIQAVTACQAGYGIRVTAQLPASASYVSSNGGMMGQMGTYDGMMNTVTWNYTGTDSMMCNYLASSSYAYNITLNSATAYSGNISWSVQAANPGNTDSNSSNDNGTAYLSWTESGGATYDYGISSGTPSYPTTTAGNSLSGTIYIADVQTACQAGYGVRVVAQLPTSASYVSSNAGMMGGQGTYDSMMNTVTWNYTGTTACRDLATAMYPYRITLSSATAYSGNISWSVSAANPGNTDSNSSNDNGTQYFTWTETEVDLQIVTPIGGGTGRAYNTPVTGSIYIHSEGNINVDDIVITANIPAGTNYVGSNGTYDGMMNTVTRNVGTAYTGGPFSVMLESQSPGYETSMNRQVTTSDNDTNLTNNSYNQVFGWDM